MVISSPPTRQSARQASGMTIEQAAHRARVSPAYLRRIEQAGGASFHLASRLARLYGCRIDLFLLTPGEKVLALRS